VGTASLSRDARGGLQFLARTLVLFADTLGPQKFSLLLRAGFLKIEASFGKDPVDFGREKDVEIAPAFPFECAYYFFHFFFTSFGVVIGYLLLVIWKAGFVRPALSRG
jgi:hypothetical protein